MPGRKPSDEFHITVKKVERRQITAVSPAHLGEFIVARLAVKLRYAKENQLDRLPPRILITVAFDLGINTRLDRQLLAQLSQNGGLRLLPILQLAAGKLPLAGVILVRPAAADQNLPFALDDSGGNYGHLRGVMSGNLAEIMEIRLRKPCARRGVNPR